MGQSRNNESYEAAIISITTPDGALHVTRKKVNVIAVFFVGGLGSGLLTLALVNLNRWFIWTAIGLVFLLGLVLSFATARSQRWLSVTTSGNRYLVSALMISASYIIALWLVLFPVSMLCEGFLSSQNPNELSSVGGSSTSFALGLLAAGATSSALIALALWVATRRWDTTVFLLMLLCGAGAIVLTSAIAWVLDIRDSIPVLFAIGEPLMAAMCGYWLVRATPVS
jgi:hypothetical protein